MARPARLSLAGELHYLVQYGHSAKPVFIDDADRGAYLAMLHEAARACGVAVHAHALLDSQVHLLLTPADAAAVGRLMQSLGRRYVAAFNQRHGRSGSLWDGRFRSALVDAESLGLEAIVHVETMPVVAGLAANAREWPWSSAGHHVGRVRDPVITEHRGYWRLGNTPFERELAHAHRLETGVSEAHRTSLLQAVRQGRAVGGPLFLARLARAAGIDIAPKPRGRPRGAAQKISVPN